MQDAQNDDGRCRRYPRVRRRRPVMVRREDDPGAVSFARLETVSLGGALLRCDEPIPASADTELSICLAGAVIRVRARVLYHVLEHEGLGIGVKFLELTGDSSALLGKLVSSEGNEEPA